MRDVDTWPWRCVLDERWFSTLAQTHPKRVTVSTAGDKKVSNCPFSESLSVRTSKNDETVPNRFDSAPPNPAFVLICPSAQKWSTETTHTHTHTHTQHTHTHTHTHNTQHTHTHTPVSMNNNNNTKPTV